MVAKMGAPISSFNEFETTLNNIKGQPSLMVFLLYDSRPSHSAVAEFTAQQTIWIDEEEIRCRCKRGTLLKTDTL